MSEAHDPQAVRTPTGTSGPPRGTLTPARLAAGEDWYARHRAALYRYVYRRVQNREEAEDLTQEACARALAGHGSAPPPTGYLYTVALNLIRDRWRRLRSRGTLTPLEEAWLAADDHSEGLLDRLWLQGLLQRLPEDQRTVLRLRIIEGRSRAETARRMARSEASVRGLQYRALQALREMARGAGEIADRHGRHGRRKEMDRL